MGRELSWEQKLQALQALAEYPENTAVRMRKPGDWYCSVSGIEVKNGHSLTGKYGNGDTPEEAVSNCFLVLTTLAENEVLVRSFGRPKEMHLLSMEWFHVEDGRCAGGRRQMKIIAKSAERIYLLDFFFPTTETKDKVELFQKVQMIYHRRRRPKEILNFGIENLGPSEFLLCTRKTFEAISERLNLFYGLHQHIVAL